MKTTLSKASLAKMRESYRSIRKQSNYKKYTQLLPDFPSDADLNLTEAVVKSEQKFVLHSKQTMTTMESGKSIKLTKFLCRKDTVATVIIRTDIPQLGKTSKECGDVIRNACVELCGITPKHVEVQIFEDG